MKDIGGFLARAVELIGRAVGGLKNNPELANAAASLAAEAVGINRRLSQLEADEAADDQLAAQLLKRVELLETAVQDVNNDLAQWPEWSRSIEHRLTTAKLVADQLDARLRLLVAQVNRSDSAIADARSRVAILETRSSGRLAPNVPGLEATPLEAQGRRPWVSPTVTEVDPPDVPADFNPEPEVPPAGGAS